MLMRSVLTRERTAPIVCDVHVSALTCDVHARRRPMSGEKGVCILLSEATRERKLGGCMSSAESAPSRPASLLFCSLQACVVAVPAARRMARRRG